ncbi:hypothetical protein BS47DRAFT_1396870 [Hydnum rufescens UP504]|uniref:Uncharacterized protein n=1 Tax=Hydnum rufescens UP504 TaxID=1448309 RepID=A0A9P6DTA1_9AGAM|nr:hypothetical protein BS47DRAFT_1396870 [Hydnum rufescens UP504]
MTEEWRLVNGGVMSWLKPGIASRGRGSSKMTIIQVTFITENMTLQGITKAGAQTIILPLPPGPSSLLGAVPQPQANQGQSNTGSAAEREALNGVIATLEASLAGNGAATATGMPPGVQALIERITAETVTATTAAAMAAISTSASLTKSEKKHALSAANYVSAEAVSRSGIIPEIILHTARKGFFVPFADMTASQYRDYVLNDWTIKKVTRAVEGGLGLVKVEYVDDTNSDAHDRNLPKHEWVEAQTCFLQLLQMEGVADELTVENFCHLYQFIMGHSLWDFNFAVLARAEHTLRQKFFTSPFRFADADLEREVQDVMVSYNQDRLQSLSHRVARDTDQLHQSQLWVPQDCSSFRFDPLSQPADHKPSYNNLSTPITPSPLQHNNMNPFRGSNERASPEAQPVRDILLANGIRPIMKWVDDFKFINPPLQTSPTSSSPPTFPPSRCMPGIFASRLSQYRLTPPRN